MYLSWIEMFVDGDDVVSDGFIGYSCGVDGLSKTLKMLYTLGYLDMVLLGDKSHKENIDYDSSSFKRPNTTHKLFITVEGVEYLELMAVMYEL